MSKPEWKVSYTYGKVGIQSDDFTHDAVLYLTGDFATHEMAIGYAAKLAARLNGSVEKETEARVLEQAAKVCEDLSMYDEDDPGSSYAAAIRSLITNDASE